MEAHVATNVEQFWHPVPGGTAYATGRTLAALLTLDKYRITGLAARQNKNVDTSSCDKELAAFRTIVPVANSRLPRPVLYESWLRFRRPMVESFAGSHNLVWSSAMVTPASSAPIVTTVHDLFFLDDPSHLSRRGRSFFPRAWRAAKKYSSVIVCPSVSVANDCERFGFSADSLHVVPWGVDIPEAPLSSEPFSIQTDVPIPKEYVLWVGTIEPRKNLKTLVEACRQDDRIHLVVVGADGWDIDGKDILAPLGTRVSRLGHVEPEVLDALYRDAKAFVFPSYAEGFGLPVLEAMARGVPTITSQNTATAEVLGECGICIDPKDPKAILSAIIELYENVSLHRSLAEKAKKRAKLFTWEKTAAGYADIFDEVLKAKAPR